MMDHIVHHSEQVCRVAVCLTENLNNGGNRLNIELIRTAALLHDITKTRSFTTQENHAQTGAELLEERGFTEVGHIVGQHVQLKAYFASKKPGEAEIVNYADKRVLHDQIVSLTDRMTYILERYAEGPEGRQRIMDLWDRSQVLEKRLFSDLSFPPRALKGVVCTWDTQPH